MEDSSGIRKPPMRSRAVTLPSGSVMIPIPFLEALLPPRPPAASWRRLACRRLRGLGACGRLGLRRFLCLRRRDREDQELAVGRERGTVAARMPQFFAALEIAHDEFTIIALRSDGIREPLAVGRQPGAPNRPPVIERVVCQRPFDRRLRCQRPLNREQYKQGAAQRRTVATEAV